MIVGGILDRRPSLGDGMSEKLVVVLILSVMILIVSSVVALVLTGHVEFAHYMMSRSVEVVGIVGVVLVILVMLFRS